MGNRKHTHTYGLQLNYDKCELLAINCNPRPRVSGGRRIPSVQETTYLGCRLNEHAAAKQELDSRLRACVVKWKRLGTLWKHTRCPKGHNIRLYNAVIHLKLLYGLESLHLTPSQARRMDTFRLREYRQIMKITTTYANRDNTNEFVYAQAKEAAASGSKDPEKASLAARPISTIHAEARTQFLGHLLRMGAEDPLRVCTFTGGCRPSSADHQRVGRPRQHWTEESCKLAWPFAQQMWDMEAQPLNLNTGQHQRDLLDAATMHAF